jgi:hypothetical protein
MGMGDPTLLTPLPGRGTRWSIFLVAKYTRRLLLKRSSSGYVLPFGCDTVRSTAGSPYVVVRTRWILLHSYHVCPLKYDFVWFFSDYGRLRKPGREVAHA